MKSSYTHRRTFPRSTTFTHHPDQVLAFCSLFLDFPGTNCNGLFTGNSGRPRPYESSFLIHLVGCPFQVSYFRRQFLQEQRDNDLDKLYFFVTRNQPTKRAKKKTKERQNVSARGFNNRIRWFLFLSTQTN